MIFNEMFAKILPIFIQKYQLPYCGEQDSSSFVKMDHYSKIRLSKFSTSMHNESEDHFQRMRELFQSLVGLFLKQSQEYANAFAEAIVSKIDEIQSL